MESVGMNLRRFFQGKKVLVTGHTGFKGSWLVLWLHLLGAKVTGYALPPERKEDLFALLGLERFVKHVEGDVRDYDYLRKVIEETQPEIVFHLAAQSLVRRSYLEPKSTFDTNVGGSVNVLEAIRKTKSVRSVVYITSDKCYRNKEWVWGYRENDEIGGKDPYSASKACAEIVFASYQESFFNERPDIGLASARAGNVIGGGDWAEDRIVPDCIRALRLGKPVRVRNPEARRPWQHVLEPLWGYLLLAERLYNQGKKFSGAWNFGPDRRGNRSVRELVQSVISRWGGGDFLVEDHLEDTRFREAQVLHLNWDKAYYKLGWEPIWDFEKAVYYTTLWYKEWINGSNVWNLTTSQIEDYMDSAIRRWQL